MGSRLLTDLEATARRKIAAVIGDAKNNGIDLLVTSTYRSFAEQDELFARGRERQADGTWKIVNKRDIVTNARGGESYHNVRRAVDLCPLIGGKPFWDESDIWPKIGDFGRNHGLTWGGLWKFQDLPHLQWDFCEKHGRIHGNAMAFTETGACAV